AAARASHHDVRWRVLQPARQIFEGPRHRLRLAPHDVRRLLDFCRHMAGGLLYGAHFRSKMGFARCACTMFLAGTRRSPNRLPLRSSYVPGAAIETERPSPRYSGIDLWE